VKRAGRGNSLDLVSGEAAMHASDYLAMDCRPQLPQWFCIFRFLRSCPNGASQKNNKGACLSDYQFAGCLIFVVFLFARNGFV